LWIDHTWQKIVLPITFTGGVYIVPMHAAFYIDIVPLGAHGLSWRIWFRFSCTCARIWSNVHNYYKILGIRFGKNVTMPPTG
jgi:hypothetical protein